MDRRLSKVSVSNVSVGLDISGLFFPMSFGLRTEMLWKVPKDLNLGYEVRIEVHDATI